LSEKHAVRKRSESLCLLKPVTKNEKSVITNGVKTRLVSAHQARSACLSGFRDKALIPELSPQCFKKALRNS